MPLVEPDTLSTGFLAVHYITTNWPDNPPERITRFRLAHDVDVFDAPLMTAIAQGAASHIATIAAKQSFTYVGWVYEDTNRVEVYGGAPLMLTQGAHDVGDANGSPSRLLTFIGRGVPPILGLNYDETRCIVHCGRAYNPTPGQHYYLISSVPAWQAFADWLDGHPQLWFDRYGQKARTKLQLTLHFNAYLQHFRGA